MILLFASAYRDLYRRDLLNVCSGRRGGRVLYSYDLRWVPKPLCSSEALLGKNALTVFCENLDVGEGTPDDVIGKHLSDGRVQYHPVRLVKIVEARLDAESIDVELELLDFFDYGKGNDAIQAILDAFQALVVQDDNRPVGAKHGASFVRSETNETYIGDDYLTKDWWRSVDHIRKLRGLNNCSFYRLERFLKGGRSQTWLTRLLERLWPPQKVSMWDRYTATSGQASPVAVDIVRGPKAGDFPPEIAVNESVATVIGPFISQRSGGLRADFMVQFRKTFETLQSGVVVHEPRRGGAAGDDRPPLARSPELQGVVTLKASGLVLSTAVALLVGGTLLMSFGKGDVAGTWSQLEIPRYLLFKGFGLVCSALGALIGFRKLPK